MQDQEQLETDVTQSTETSSAEVQAPVEANKDAVRPPIETNQGEQASEPQDSAPATKGHLIQKPTIGRIVHYHSGAGEEVLAALIIDVQEDNKVNLKVFSREGVMNTMLGVPHKAHQTQWACWTYPARV